MNSKMWNLNNVPFLCVILISFTTISLSLQSDNNESFCESLDKKAGVCISIKSQIKFCAPLYDLLKDKNWGSLRNNICDNNNTRVCCPLDDFNEIPKQVTEPDYTKHPNFKLLPSLSNCGLSYSLSDRIIGGNTSKPGELPWMVRLGFQEYHVSRILFEDESVTGVSYDDREGGNVQFICGGTLISNRYVLTAAHCFKHPHQVLKKIVLGETDEDIDEECIESDGLDGVKTKIACTKPIEIPPESIITHPGYDQLIGSVNDLALVRLKEEVDTESYFTRPICLPFLNEYHISRRFDDSRLIRENLTIVSGWGKTNNYEAVGSSNLQYVRVPIQPHIFCRVSYGSYNLTKDQICAGGIKGQDSCLGDSGGPLFLAANPEKQSRSLRAFQLGIVSYGKTTCAKGGEPVVYTRVRSFLTWILDNIKK